MFTQNNSTLTLILSPLNNKSMSYPHPVVKFRLLDCFKKQSGKFAKQVEILLRGTTKML